MPFAMAHERAESNAGIITGASLLALAGVGLFVVPRPPSWVSLAVLGCGVIIAAVAIGWEDCRCRSLVPAASAAEPAGARCGLQAASLQLLFAAAFLAMFAGWTASRLGQPGVSNADVARFWLPSVALFLLAAWWEPIVRAAGRLRAGRMIALRPPWRAALSWAGMITIAALPRLLMLDRYPTVLDGDEGSFMVIARQSRLGEPPNAFGPGFLSNPNLYPVVEGWVAGLFGSSPADYRVLSGVVGALGVVATWRLARYLVEPGAAMAAGVTLATMPFHLHFSRMALNNITDPTVLAASLLLLMRSVTFGRARDAALTGVVLGLGFHGYFGGRVFPAVVLLALAILVVGRRERPREAAWIGAWALAGFVITALPLMMAFRRVPSELWGRLDTVSPISLDALRGNPGGTIELYLANLRDAVLYPIAGYAQGFYRHDAPLVGWPVALLLAAGGAALLVRMTRDRHVPTIACVVTPTVVILGGVALTVPLQSQRLLAMTPVWAIVAGAGLALVARWVGLGAKVGSIPLAQAALAVALAALVVGDLRWFASEDRQAVTYGDYTGTAMWDIGWRAAAASPDGDQAPRVLFAGPPFVFTGGFNSLVIQAPKLAMSDVVEPLGTHPSPGLLDGTMVVIVPHRAAERCEAERIYPSATVAEARSRDGTLLYIALYREPLEGWSFEQTPAETTFEVVTDSPCG
jgi:4-amino-4-deoxy-L-arabinose transferase-like glycosyltransferase